MLPTSNETCAHCKKDAPQPFFYDDGSVLCVACFADERLGRIQWPQISDADHAKLFEELKGPRLKKKKKSKPKRKPPEASISEELEAYGRAHAALKPLSKESRRRALEWLGKVLRT